LIFRYAKIGLAAAGFAAIVISTAPVDAASGGYSIAPFVQDVTIAQTQPSVKETVTISNNTTQATEFKLSTENFGSLNNTGGVAFLGTSASGFAQRHGLSDWMSLDQTDVTVPAGGNVEVGVTIQNSPLMSFGGHYGAVIATAQTAPTGPVTKNRVGVLEELSSLILLIKEGGPPPDLVLLSQTVPPAIGSLPTSETDNFSNEGDVHVVPRGITTMYDPLGREVMGGALNVNSSTILPGMVRTYSTPLMKLANAWMPGEYKLVTDYRYDGTETTKKFVTYFWYSGSSLLWGVVAVALLVMGGGLGVIRRFGIRMPKLRAGKLRR
jgi:hypothetical protein